MQLDFYSSSLTNDELCNYLRSTQHLSFMTPVEEMLLERLENENEEAAEAYQELEDRCAELEADADFGEDVRNSGFNRRDIMILQGQEIDDWKNTVELLNVLRLYGIRNTKDLKDRLYVSGYDPASAFNQ